jgi:hypothetical protein
MQPHAHQLPNAAARAAMSVNDLMHTTLRLSDLLAEESELIEAMRYKDLARLHEEKLKLTSAPDGHPSARWQAETPNRCYGSRSLHPEYGWPTSRAGQAPR